MRLRTAIWEPLLIITATVVAYANSFAGVFLLDDSGWLTKNINTPELMSHITHSTRPFTALLFFVNYHVSGTNPADYHLVNLLIHISAALLLYGITRRTLLTRKQSSSDCLRFVPLFAALLWAVHPLQTESVTYIVQRAESLTSMFYLLTLYLALRGTQPSRHSREWLIGSVCACALGMLSKPIMVTAPFMVLLYDRTFISKSATDALKSRKLFYAALGATLLITAFLVIQPNESSATAGFSAGTPGPMQYLATQPGIILHYLKLIIYPRDLCLDYAWPLLSSPTQAILPAFLVLGMMIISFALLWKKSVTGFCMAWFFIILIPTSSIIPVADFAVEHRLYLALAGPLTIVAFLVPATIALLTKKYKRPRLCLSLSTVIVFIAVVSLVLRTIDRNRIYTSKEAFCRDILKNSPHNFRAGTMLINSLIEQGKLSQAETEANILIKRMQAEVQTGNEAHWTPATDPRLHLPVTYTMLGMIMLNREDSRAAEKHLLQALSLDSGSHNAQHLLAVAYMGEDRYPEALKAVELAIKLKPQSSASRTLAGVILSKQGYFNQALSRFEEALTMNPNDPIANLEAAMLLATSPTLQKTNGSEALQLAQRALALSGETARTLDVLAAAYAATGKFDAATQLAQKALNMTSESQPTSSADTLLKSVPQNIRQRLNRYRTAKPWQREN